MPYTPQRMLALRPEEVYRKIVAAGRLAEGLGAKMLGLGAYTSVVGDGGQTIARELDIAVTTGDSYTAAVSVSATLEAARMMEIDLDRRAVGGGRGVWRHRRRRRKDAGAARWAGAVGGAEHAAP